MELRDRDMEMSWLNGFIILILASMLVFFTKQYVFVVARVFGTSMEETLTEGDLLYTTRVNKGTEVNRGDVITLKEIEGVTEGYYVKRVIGLPGETVSIIEGTVHIEGEPLEEDYAFNVYRDPYEDFSWDIGEDEYFIMGDNRGMAMSYDSRYFGPVKKDNLLSIAKYNISSLYDKSKNPLVE